MKRTFALLLSLVMVAVFFAGCSGGDAGSTGSSAGTQASSGSAGGDSGAPASEDGPIRIGGIMIVTGVMASDGELMNRGIELAVKQANDAGGVLGREVTYSNEDAGSTPDVAVNAANKAVSGNYDVVFGPHLSSQVLAVTDILNESEQLNVIGGTNYTIMDQLTNPYSVRCRVPDVISARASAVYMGENLGCKKVGILHVSDDFGESARVVASEYFDSEGIEYAVETFNTDDRDFTTQLLNLRNAGVDSVLIWSLGDTAVVICRQMNELGMSGLKVMNNGAITTPDLRERMEPEWYDGWYSNTQWNPTSTDPASVKFNEDYSAEYDQMPSFLSAAWYSTTQWYLDCVEKAGTTDKDAVLEQMKQTKDWPALNGNYSWRDRDLCNSVFMVQCHADGTIEDKALVEG